MKKKTRKAQKKGNGVTKKEIDKLKREISQLRSLNKNFQSRILGNT